GVLTLLLGGQGGDLQEGGNPSEGARIRVPPVRGGEWVLVTSGGVHRRYVSRGVVVGDDRLVVDALPASGRLSCDEGAPDSARQSPGGRGARSDRRVDAPHAGAVRVDDGPDGGG